MTGFGNGRTGGSEYGAQPARRVNDGLDDIYGAPGGGAPAQAPIVPPLGENEVVFSRSYKAHDADVRRVRFREPNTGDLRKAGFPLRNVVTPGVGITAIEELPDVVCKYICALSDPPLPPSTVNALDLDDFARCQQVIMGFFLK